MSNPKLMIIMTLKILIIPSLAFTWSKDVNGFDQEDPENGYASSPNFSLPVQAIKVCGGHKYRVHANGRWLRPVNGCDINDPINGHSGGEEYIIDGISIDNATYDVSVNNTWMGVVTGYNTEDGYNGFGGILGWAVYGLSVNLGYNYSVAYGFPNSKPKPLPPEQIFVDYGTGIKDIPTKNNIEHLQNGDLFINYCVICGAANKQQILDGYYFCLTYNYIDAASLELGKFTRDHVIEFLGVLADYFGNNVNPSLIDVVYNGFHYLVDENEKEVFNSVELGYRPE